MRYLFSVTRSFPLRTMLAGDRCIVQPGDILGVEPRTLDLLILYRPLVPDPRPSLTRSWPARSRYSTLRLGRTSRRRSATSSEQIASSCASLPADDRSFRGLSRQFEQRCGEMLAVVQEENPPCTALHQERDQRSVRLRGVAVPARQHQVVRPVIGGLSPPGPDMVQCDGVFRGIGPAIGAHRPMLGQEPIAVGLH
jgi:hypothetical protein